MANLHRLKEQARALEQGGQLQAALELFARAAQRDGLEPVEPEVWLRLGDLQRRTGRPGEAVASYERAVAGLADAELRNCALAVCLRILEIDPDHDDAYLRLGELAAMLGYPRQARHGYLEFAERAVRRGSVRPALDALRAYLAHFPDDAAARRLLVDAYLSQDEPRQAIAELQSLEGLLRRRGALAAAVEVNQELESLYRETGQARDAAPATPQADASGFHLELLPLHSLPDVRAVPSAPEPLDGMEIEPTLIPVEGHDLPPGGVAPLEGLEPTVAGVEPTGAGEGDAEPLPLLGLERADRTEPLRRWPEVGDRGPEPEEDEAEEADPLPLLGTGFEPPEPAAPVTEPLPETGLLDRLTERLASQPEDLDAWRRLIALLRERGAQAQLVDTLRRAHPFVARAGHPGEAADLMEWLGEIQPLDPAELRTRVDYASRADDPPRLVRALLALATGLLAERDLAGADAVYRHVLELDPHNLEAQRALHIHAPTPARGEEDYVDLGALILDGGAEGLTPLSTGPAPHAEQGEEFDDLLALLGFSAAEPISPHDAASHYDLGLAFKEMGLLDDALAQLQLALRGGANPLATLEALGECVFHRGDHALAARVLHRATQLRGASDTDLVGVRYWLGRCEQATGRTADALGRFQQVVAVDPGFRDAAERLHALRSL